MKGAKLAQAPDKFLPKDKAREAATVLEAGVSSLFFKDGKPKGRDALFKEIKSKPGLLDELNCLNATWIALHYMHKAFGDPALETQIAKIDREYSLAFGGEISASTPDPVSGVPLDFSTKKAAEQTVRECLLWAIDQAGIPQADRPRIFGKVKDAFTIPDVLETSEPPHSSQNGAPKGAGGGSGPDKGPTTPKKETPGPEQPAAATQAPGATPPSATPAEEVSKGTDATPLPGATPPSATIPENVPKGTDLTPQPGATPPSATAPEEVSKGTDATPQPASIATPSVVTTTEDAAKGTDLTPQPGATPPSATTAEEVSKGTDTTPLPTSSATTPATTTPEDVAKGADVTSQPASSSTPPAATTPEDVARGTDLTPQPGTVDALHATPEKGDNLGTEQEAKSPESEPLEAELPKGTPGPDITQPSDKSDAPKPDSTETVPAASGIGVYLFESGVYIAAEDAEQATRMRSGLDADALKEITERNKGMSAGTVLMVSHTVGGSKPVTDVLQLDGANLVTLGPIKAPQNERVKTVLPPPSAPPAQQPAIEELYGTDADGAKGAKGKKRTMDSLVFTTLGSLPIEMGSKANDELLTSVRSCSDLRKQVEDLLSGVENGTLVDSDVGARRAVMERTLDTYLSAKRQFVLDVTGMIKVRVDRALSKDGAKDPLRDYGRLLRDAQKAIVPDARGYGNMQEVVLRQLSATRAEFGVMNADEGFVLDRINAFRTVYDVNNPNHALAKPVLDMVESRLSQKEQEVSVAA